MKRKENIQHLLLVLLASLAMAGGISLFLNQVSYNPDFSVMDAISGATKKSRCNQAQEETAPAWEYTLDDVSLSEEAYADEVIVTAETAYKVLKHIPDETAGSIVLLSNRENKDYQNAVQSLTDYLETQGYQVQIKTCSEIMMLSLVHAGHFDLFLMSEEAVQ